MTKTPQKNHQPEMFKLKSGKLLRKMQARAKRAVKGLLIDAEYTGYGRCMVLSH